MFGGLTFGGAPFGGVVAITSLLAGHATISVSTTAILAPSATAASIRIAGVDVRARVRMRGLTIHDILNDAPNTCSLTIEGAGPAVGQSLRITLATGQVLFAGTIQTVDQSFALQPTQVAWAVTAIDDTGKANAKRPFGRWVTISATTIAQAIAAQCAPAFSTAGIAAGLPPVTIVYDGSDTFIAALARLANAIGGYCKVEDGTIYLFLEDLTAAPDPIDPAHPFLHDPPIRSNVDSSQLRTRVYGKGYGEAIQADLAADETLVPIQNGATFPALGGTAIAATTADGAQWQQLAYTGVLLAAGGTLVGPGAGPTTAPLVVLAAGAGIDSGDHSWAYVFKTATGRSRPSAITTLAIGTVPAPSTAPTVGALQAGLGPDDGAHQFAVSWVTATGETPPGPRVSKTTSSSVVPPPTAPTAASHTFEVTTLWTAGDQIFYVMTYVNPNGQTTPSSVTATVTVQVAPSGDRYRIAITNILNSGDPSVTTKRLYRNRNGIWEGYFETTATFFNDGGFSTTPGTPPAANTATNYLRVVPLTLPVPTSALVTSKKIWGTPAGSTQLKLIASGVAVGTTAYTVTTPDASLGPNAPTTNTATANRAAVTVPAGPTGTTDLEIYRTPVGSAQLKLVMAVGSNTASTLTDSTPDAGLGIDAPTDDTSGLTQPAGQVNAGSTVLPVASPAPFRSAGGWVTLGGGQVVRYTAITGQSLTGIPASGPGAITTTVLYGSQAIPAPMLTGVTGLTAAVLKGSAVHIWVQRDDLAAQAEQAARAGGDGVIEFVIVDTRRGIDSLTARCDADLALFARPIVTVEYATRDLKTKSGKTVVIDVPAPAIHETLIIQDVTITEIDIVPRLAPRFTVRASSVRFTLADILRRLIAGGPIEAGED